MSSRISLANLTRGGGNKPPIGVLYGRSGIGKTTLAAQFPSPIFLQTEDGLTSPTLAHVPTLGVMGSFEQVLDGIHVIGENAAKQGWHTLVVDTLSKLDPMIIDYTSRTYFNGQRLGDVPFGKGWDPYVGEWRKFIQLMMDIRNFANMNVLMLDHAQMINVNPPDAESYKRYTLAVSPRVAPAVIGDLDFLFFATYPLSTIKQDLGFNKTHTRAVNDRPRLHCQDRASADAKNRYAMPEWIPFEYEQVTRYLTTLAGLQPQNPVAAVAAQ